MFRILDIAAHVGTPLALLGLIAALVFYAYSRRLKQRVKSLELLQPADRATAVAEGLARYNIPTEKLSGPAAERLLREEMDKRYQLSRFYAAVFAVAFVVCFVAAAVAYGVANAMHRVPEDEGRPPEHQEHPLSLSLLIRGADLLSGSGYCPAGTNVAAKNFEGPDREKVLEVAAEWLKEKLNEQFPPSNDELTVTATLSLDQKGRKHRVEVHSSADPDPLRQDRFWDFMQNGRARPGKMGHPLIESAREAIAAEIEELRVQKSKSSLVLHTCRPGYDLALFELPVTGGSDTATLKPMPLAVLIDIEKEAAGRLAAMLADGRLEVFTQEHVEGKRDSYRKSTNEGLTNGQRLILLRQARVDVFITGGLR
jgi:hypothetical protein